MNLLEIAQTKSYAGYIGIEVQKKVKATGQEYASTDIRYTDLSRVSKPLYLDNNIPTPMFHMIHMGGGFMGGETYRTDLIVKDNSSAIFTSQSASKIYKVKNPGEPAIYEINLEAGENSIVEFINDAVILYPNAEYNQFNIFNLKGTSNLFYSEIFSPGYSPDGKKYMYTEMWLNTKIYVDGKLLLFDNLNFQPQLENPGQFGIMDGFDRCGTSFFVGPIFNERMVEEIRELVASLHSNIKHEIGISCFANNAIGVRVLANETYEIEKIFKTIHNHLRKVTLGLGELHLRKQ